MQIFQQSSKLFHAAIPINVAMFQTNAVKNDVLLWRSHNNMVHWLANRTWEIGGHFLVSVATFSVCGFPCFLYEFLIILLITQWISLWDGLRWVLDGKNQLNDIQMMYTTLKICIHRSIVFVQKYPFLWRYHMAKTICDQLFKKEDVTWVLSTIPYNGFYANLLDYQRSHYPSLTNRDVGMLLSKIDPHLAVTVKKSGG